MGGDGGVGEAGGRGATHCRRRVALAVLLALVLGTGLTACGGDSSDEAELSSPTVAPNDDAPEGSPPASDGGGTGDGAALTSEDVCSAVDVEAVAAATGLEVTGAEPSDGSTPQCLYSYPSEGGPDSNLTVAASRYLDSDAQSIEEAFDTAVQVNIATAGGDDVEQAEVDAGDEAVLLSGTALTLGVLRVGDVLASVIVPPDTITLDRYEDLMVAIGDAFS